MSYFDEASLVMIPSGYKNQKVYSVKPLDGSGDLTFSRASSATRVASNGLIEKVRTNLALQSNTFSNASWIKTDVSVTSGQAGYDGTTNAWLVANTAASGNLTQTISFSGFNTLSFYAKAGTHNYIFLLLNGGGFNATAVYNLSTGAITDASGDALITTATSVGNGWWRITITGSRSNSDFRIYPTNTNGAATTNGNILVQNVQLEAGDIATDYIATTSAAVSVGPVSGVPRLDYLNSTCPRLLLEPQRTNLAIYSEQFDNAGWGKSQSGTGLVPVVTANNAISPDGYQNADTIVFDAGAGTTASDISAISQTFGGTTATYTASFYAKTASGTAQVQVRIDGSNYDKFTITNQWQRFTLTKALTGTSNVFEMAIRRGLNEPMNASATIQLWGVQVELGAYATSYIPTLGTSVTRVADAALTGSVPSLIGQTAGTIFWQGSVDYRQSGDGHALALSGSASSFGDAILLYRQSSNGHLAIYIQIGGANQFGTPLTYNDTASVSENDKYAIAYANNDLVVYKNGVQIISASSGSIPACNYFLLNEWNNTYVNTNITKQAILFPTRLSNSDLASLTA